MDFGRSSPVTESRQAPYYAAMDLAGKIVADIRVQIGELTKRLSPWMAPVPKSEENKEPRWGSSPAMGSVSNHIASLQGLSEELRELLQTLEI